MSHTGIQDAIQDHRFPQMLYLGYSLTLDSMRMPTHLLRATAKHPVMTPMAKVMMNLARVCPVYLPADAAWVVRIEAQHKMLMPIPTRRVSSSRPWGSCARRRGDSALRGRSGGHRNSRSHQGHPAAPKLPIGATNLRSLIVERFRDLGGRGLLSAPDL